MYVCVYIYIYIYVCAVKLLTGPSLAFLMVTKWAKLMVTNWAMLISHYQNRAFRPFLVLAYNFACFFVSSYLPISKKGANIGFSNFCVLSLHLEGSLLQGLPKHYRNRGFSQFLCFVLLKEKK